MVFTCSVCVLERQMVGLVHERERVRVRVRVLLLVTHLFRLQLDRRMAANLTRNGNIRI